MAAGREPWWYLPLYAAVMVVGFQYSAGLKLSYLGAQELVLFLVKFSSVFFPFALVTGRTGAAVTLQALLFATWAVLLSERGHHRFVAGLFATGWALAVGGVVAGVLSPWYCLTLLPVVTLQAEQLRRAVRGRRYLEARSLGFRVLRIGVPLLSITNLGLHWR